MPKKVLFLVPYPTGESPSQRFRFEHYFSELEARGFSYTVRSFLNQNNWQIFFKPGRFPQKGWALLTGFARRWASVFEAPFYDFIFIHRETTPVGPPVMEWLLAKLLRRKIIYDFDDAIWLTDRKHEPWFLRVLKWRSKVELTCRWAYKISCGNEYLADYARRFNRRVYYMPTVVDTAHWHNPALYPEVHRDPAKITIGWTGSHSTLKYLKDLVPVLQQLELEYHNLSILIIADQKPDFDLSSLLFIPWSKAAEVRDLMRIDIGIMPLPDDEWAKGKCGFKAIQYMALGIPAVVSPVGVNTQIVDHDRNGFVAATPQEWYAILKKLIEDKALIRQAGASSRQKIIDAYSVSSTASSFISLFE